MRRQKVNIVFLTAAALVAVTALWGLLRPKQLEAAAGILFQGITGGFGWFYPLAMTLFTGFAVWIGFFGKYKHMRLGPDDSRPEYSNTAWFAMLFSAGMSVGLVFWSVAEPLQFYVEPLGAEGGTAAAEEFAFAKAFLHWGIHPWANYAVMALALAYMQYRKGQPSLISSLFVPVVGEKHTRGVLGKCIDVLALLATAGGVCTTLGLGVMQINSGMNFIFDIPITTVLVVGTVVVLSVIYVATAAAGVEKGSALVSNANVIIAAAVVVFLFLAGPTVDILNNLMEGTGVYLSRFIHDSFALGAFEHKEWYGSWTIYYWAWWIAWAPFTGSFIARISRGRTVRELIAGVMLLPAAASMVWFAVFGTLGMDLGLDFAREAVQSASTALFTVLAQYPLGKILSVVMLVLVCTFFCASATSATIVLGMYSEHGTLHPSNRSKVIWGVLLAVLTLSLMLSSENGLDMLKTLSIVVGFPFAIIKVLSLVSFQKALVSEDTEAIDQAYSDSRKKEPDTISQQYEG